MENRILVVDDEIEIAELITLYLKNDGFAVSVCHNGADALELIKTESFDLAVLDIMLPDASGLQLCAEIRKTHQYPVIMLTAKDSEMDKITGLSIGADDYITKPFRPLELVARIKAQLRRYLRYNQPAPEEDDWLSHGGLMLNKRTHECLLNEKPLSLTRAEFLILYKLLREKGKVIDAEELFHEVWGDDYYNKRSNTIPVHIRNLREKMGDSFENPKYIKTVWGCGYKIEN